jgi:hypothetical protein
MKTPCGQIAEAKENKRPRLCCGRGFVKTRSAVIHMASKQNRMVSLPKGLVRVRDFSLVALGCGNEQGGMIKLMSKVKHKCGKIS